MTPEQWEALIPRVTLPGFSPPVRLHYAGGGRGPTVVIERDLVDIDTGQPKTFRTVEVLPTERWRNQYAAMEFLFSAVARALAHEVEELLCLDGRKVFSPHGVTR